ncbi:hypothetical protein [Lysinibacter sp. HNR]|nr:hypothetical protein [Lysinibacter sp. HNR]WGD38163.1 hypothetical protein FrondiHNR_04405 [Lysinibacter sp. HNR]
MSTQSNESVKNSVTNKTPLLLSVPNIDGLVEGEGICSGDSCAF